MQHITILHENQRTRSAGGVIFLEGTAAEGDRVALLGGCLYFARTDTHSTFATSASHDAGATGSVTIAQNALTSSTNGSVPSR